MDEHFRVPDADRDRAAARLRDHFAAGRLTLEELEERLTAALNAQTFGDLRSVQADLPGPEPVPQQASRRPPHAGTLERRYRRLLVFYPVPYRRLHQDEMLAVLMTAAPAGKRRPGIAETADLIWGALRVRCQPQRDGVGPGWRDALAVLSVIGPVIFLLISTVQYTRMSLPPSQPGAFSAVALWLLRQIAAPLALVALVLLKLRRVAALAVVATLLWVALLRGGSTHVYGTADAYLFLALSLEIVALTASPGPGRGLQILTWKHGALIVSATLAVTTVTSYLVLLIVLAVICAAMALTSSLGRWLLVLLAIPAWPYFLPPPLTAPWQLLHLAPAPGTIGQAYLPPAALLAAFVISARRESLRSAQLPQASR
jgi:hypothetical protein